MPTQGRPTDQPVTPLYVETSALLRVLAEGDRDLAAALANAKRLVTSALTFVEAERALRRSIIDGRIDRGRLHEGQRWLARFARACDVAQITEPILDLARREFPVESVRTLDAIHLATLKMWKRA